MKKKMAIDIISTLFIILFVYAAIMKLMDVEKFRVQIGKSPLLTSYAEWVAWMIPSIEIIISVMLSVSRWRLLGLYLSFSLMVMFTAYIIAILNFSENIPCSCGGVLEQLGWKEHLLFNACFVLLGLLGIIIQGKVQSSNNTKNTPRRSVIGI